MVPLKLACVVAELIRCGDKDLGDAESRPLPGACEVEIHPCLDGRRFLVHRRQEIGYTSLHAGAGAAPRVWPGQRGTCEPLLMNLKHFLGHCALQEGQQDPMLALPTRTASNLWGVMYWPWPLAGCTLLPRPSAVFAKSSVVRAQ